MNSVWGIKGAWRYGAAALMLAGWAMPAAAADLGGDCCADLEERVAELEATTARKGNRKVSLTVSGWVNENIVWFDDGRESNAYVGTNPVEQSRFRFVGEAKIAPDVSAGYTLEIGVFGGNPTGWNQKLPDGTATGTTAPNSLLVRKSSWFLKSNSLGKVSVGQDATATYHLLDDADGTMTRNFYDGEGAPDYARPFLIRDKATGNLTTLSWSSVLRGFTNSTPGDSGRRNIVRYDSPTFAGFSVAATWGEDDMWDMAVVYKTSFHDFDFNARAGYGASGDGLGSACHGSTTTTQDNAMDCQWWGVSAFLQHKPTGLYAFAGYGDQLDGSKNPAIDADIVDKDSRTWFIQGGIEKKWIPLGKTNFFGEYRRDEAGSDASATGALTTTSSNINFWAVGAAQNIEAAEMTLYIVYQHVDGTVYGAPGSTGLTNPNSVEALQQVIAGAKINF